MRFCTFLYGRIEYPIQKWLANLETLIRIKIAGTVKPNRKLDMLNIVNFLRSRVVSV